MPDPNVIERAFVERRRMLWSLCYRLTGVAADADELVQETFVRALERAPALADGEWHRWLVRVATNLGLDRLRARRRRRYVGAWLPSPVETDDERDGVAGPDAVVEAYERRERTSYAFLVALEMLTPTARAVLILRDAFDYGVDEVAAVLALSPANVRVLHHRARRRLATADADPPSLRLASEPMRVALQRFLDCMTRQDAAGMEELLTASVRSVTDGGGEYTALRAPLVGVGRVVRFHLETARRRGPISRVELRTVNGLPALVIETTPMRPRMAPRIVLRWEIDGTGRIREIQSILATRKLTAVRFSSAPA
jgi:RNA polymerase sigma-70 factor (ECF subfamily)